MTTAESINPLEVGSWHIHGGWWTVGAVAGFTILSAFVLGLCIDVERRVIQLRNIEKRLTVLETALSHEPVSEPLATADPPTAPIPVPMPVADGPATTPASAAIDAGYEGLVETYSRVMGPDGLTFNFRK